MKVLIRILYASSVFFAVAGAVKFLEGFPDTRGQIMDATAFSVSVVTLALVLEIREKMEWTQPIQQTYLVSKPPSLSAPKEKKLSFWSEYPQRSEVGAR